MKIQQFENLYQLTFLANIFPMNAYVLEQEDGLLVIDMGIKSFVKYVRKIEDYTSKKVRYLLLTHAHSDHVGGVNAFHEAYPEVPIGISARDKWLLHGDFRLRQNEEESKVRGSFPSGDIHIDFKFEDRQSIASLIVIAAPGHTPGHTAFFEPHQKLLIAGDAFQTQGGLAVSGDTRWRFPFPAFATWDKPTALKSAKYLASIKPNLLAVGHGDMLVNPTNEMEKVINRFEEKIKE